jgi:hypothetical protein
MATISSTKAPAFRLAAVLLACLVDADHTTLIIDEPELGLSPEIQALLADFLYTEAQRREYFPHLQSVIVATHSPLFLDRQNVTSNYFISRVEQVISIKQLATIQDLNSLQFLLLGNRFETLHLPSAFVLVEGLFDHTSQPPHCPPVPPCSSLSHPLWRGQSDEGGSCRCTTNARRLKEEPVC